MPSCSFHLLLFLINLFNCVLMLEVLSLFFFSPYGYGYPQSVILQLLPDVFYLITTIDRYRSSSYLVLCFRKVLNSAKHLGYIPTEFGSLSSLKTFYLGINSLSGTITAAMGNWPALQYLAFYSIPKLSGTVPSQFGLLSTLKYLGLYNNSLSGTIPTQFGSTIAVIILNKI